MFPSGSIMYSVSYTVITMGFVSAAQIGSFLSGIGVG
jgi:hypothetical protein